ncbi:MAG: cell wall hydrolase [Eubacteriales bacterium]|nr:cell wall hydrolase [Eubacteriales bacterium]
MTKGKNNFDAARLVICILAALAFGAYLGAPGPKVWAHPVSEVMTVISEQIIKFESIPNETAKDKKEIAGAVTAAGIEMIVAESQAEEVPGYICLNANRGGVADRKEKDILIHLINAEAYGLSYKAKVAVGQVVMNRWKGPYYGDDLLAIMTAPHQFTPIHNGSAFEKQIEPDSIKAANAVLGGSGVTELTGDTYYFVNPDFTEDKTIEQSMEFVCEIEGIHFYKPPTR